MMKINLETVENEKDLHNLLARSFGFPDFYGNNWDAFWDAITGLVEMPYEVEFVGSAHLKLILPQAYEHLKKCFTDLNQAYPELRCSVKWNS